MSVRHSILSAMCKTACVPYTDLSCVTFTRAYTIMYAFRTVTPVSPKQQLATTMNCPLGFTGNISRTCTDDGWTPITGRCVRKHCPATILYLDGWKADQPQEERALHIALVQSAPEGTGQMSLPCPPVNYTGDLVVNCDDDSEVWTVQKRCALVATSSRKRPSR